MVTEKITVEEKLRTEKRGIKLVLLGDLLMAILGLTFFYLTASQAILIDGIYPFIDLVAGLLTLRVVSLMAVQASQEQPFGYAIFEPVLNFIKGIMIMLVILVALYASIEAILHGGRHIKADIAVFYSFIASGLGFGLAYVLYRLNKTAQSSLIKVDLQGWLIGGILSIAVGISFAVAIWMEHNGFEKWVPYTDPVVILVLIVLMLPMPLKILKDNGMQIIGRNGSGSDLATQLEKEVHSVLDALPYDDMKLRFLEMGRMVYLQVYVQMDAEQATLSGLDLAQQDAIREHLFQRLSQKHDYLSLDVVFTASPMWAARSISNNQHHADGVSPSTK